MKKGIIVIGFVLLCCFNIYAQKTKSNPFKMVVMPDSISAKLEEAYTKNTGCRNVNAGRNVWNLVNRKDFIFKNGIYSFKGQGPHFPRLIFIYYNGRLFIFTNSNINRVLEEYLKCISVLELSEADSIKYLKAISNYLHEELGLTYGADIIKTK